MLFLRFLKVGGREPAVPGPQIDPKSAPNWHPRQPKRPPRRPKRPPRRPKRPPRQPKRPPGRPKRPPRRPKSCKMDLLAGNLHFPRVFWGSGAGNLHFTWVLGHGRGGFYAEIRVWGPLGGGEGEEGKLKAAVTPHSLVAPRGLWI